MSRHKSSPFYDPRHDPKLVQPILAMVCNCRKHGRNPDATLDTTRNMYVCKDCRRPWIQNENYVRLCFGCETLFVIWIYSRTSVNNEVCHDCGGKNAALPNMVTIDEYAEYEKQAERERSRV